MQGWVVIGKILVGIYVRQFMEFIDIFDVAYVPRVDLGAGNAGVKAFIMLSVVQAGQQNIPAVEQHTTK